MSSAELEKLASQIESNPDHAAEQLRKRLAGDPLNSEAYRLLARALEGVEKASNPRGELRTVVRGADPLLERAASAMAGGDLETAEIILRRRLLERPADPYALQLMASLAHALDFDQESESLLRLALEIAPDFLPARFALVSVFDRQNRHADVLTLMDEVLAIDPGNEPASTIRAAALGRAGRFDECLALYEQLIGRNESDPRLWSSYGLMLKTVGRSEDGRRAMRQAVEIAPRMGETWWNLSNLKTEQLSADDAARMAAALERDDVTDDDKLHLHFALGKALEDAGDPERAFAHYAEGNRIRRQRLRHDPEAVTQEVTESRRFFSREFFEGRASRGSSARDAIFIVGKPRSGSTLVEQILASHPDVEGTTELPDMARIAKRLGRRHGDYFGTISGLAPERLRELGDEYLDRTREHRIEGRPMFIDKMPNNWVHVPLIHLILPHAEIIDVRRHPLACGFSNFKQHFVRGQAFSYDLDWMGRYYADYVRMMAHIDQVLPGRVHRVIHEQLVDDSETEIRRMLDYLELPFDPACLRFYETDRAVRTPSSEQVRRPISREGIDTWRAFEPWLGPLKEALGPVLGAYPDVPDFPSE
jgi:tetratricopeptide (TPR) repeat protein